MLYTIITINYNNKEGLEQTIKSVLDQTYQGIQFIIIDGGSTDGSIDIIKEHNQAIDYWVGVSGTTGKLYGSQNHNISHTLKYIKYAASLRSKFKKRYRSNSRLN